MLRPGGGCPQSWRLLLEQPAPRPLRRKGPLLVVIRQPTSLMRVDVRVFPVTGATFVRASAPV